MINNASLVGGMEIKSKIKTMKNNLDLYNKTVDILFNAYFNDTLVHGNCHACAVGNMVAANLGISYIEVEDSTLRVEWGGANVATWNHVLCTFDTRYQRIDISEYKASAKIQIDSTGYSWQDLSKIEHAFETSDQGDNDESYMFNGLCAVLEVLKEIHGIKDDEHTTQVSRFQNHYATK